MPSHARAACVGAYMCNVCRPARQSSHLTGGSNLGLFAPAFAPIKTEALVYMIGATVTAAIATLFMGRCRGLFVAAGLVPIAAACFSVFWSSLSFSFFLQDPTGPTWQPTGPNRTTGFPIVFELFCIWCKLTVYNLKR